MNIMFIKNNFYLYAHSYFAHCTDEAYKEKSVNLS